jgi:hypothetical protein
MQQEDRKLDPRELGLTKAAYSVRETAAVTSLGRTAIYAAVKQGDLRPRKFGRKTLFLANDIAVFLSGLKNPR